MNRLLYTIISGGIRPMAYKRNRARESFILICLLVIGLIAIRLLS